jgi:hypothetical protein
MAQLDDEDRDDPGYLDATGWTTVPITMDNGHKYTCYVKGLMVVAERHSPYTNEERNDWNLPEDEKTLAKKMAYHKVQEMNNGDVESDDGGQETLPSPAN